VKVALMMKGNEFKDFFYGFSLFNQVTAQYSSLLSSTSDKCAAGTQSGAIGVLFEKKKIKFQLNFAVIKLEPVGLGFLLLYNSFVKTFSRFLL
jgi:hypothetical protein